MGDIKRYHQERNICNMKKQLKWKDSNFSKQMIADYKPFMFVDGEGVRHSLYVSGCPFACKGCFNKKIQNFNYGIPYTQELEDRIIEDLGHESVQGMTFLGGEPFLNTSVLVPLAKRIRLEFGNDKDIWSWSGYTFDEIIETGHIDKLELLGLIDVLVDGQFILSKRDLVNTPFRGSTNQKIINVQQSLKLGKPIEIEKYKV